MLEDDPIKAMLDWLLAELMKVNVEADTGAPKGKHSRERKTYFSGYRVRKHHSRLETLYLVIPKVHKGGMYHFSRDEETF